MASPSPSSCAGLTRASMLLRRRWIAGSSPAMTPGTSMLADRIEGKWIDAFCEVFARCAVKPGDTAAILSETQSRQLNVQLSELALLRLGAKPFHIVVPTPRNRHPVPVRSTGASEAIGGLAPVIGALGAAGFVVDRTLGGLVAAPDAAAVLK